MLKKIHSKDLHYNLETWIKEVLSKPNPIFNNLPACPYAKKAWMEDKVEIYVFDSWVDAYSCLLTKQWDFTNLEVGIIAFPKDNITPNQLSNMIDALQNTWPRNDLAILEDHPDELEQVQGFNLNFGDQCLLLVQSRLKLNKARAELEAKGYYKNWDPEYKKVVQYR